MKLAIKNMVCPRCIQAVSNTLAALGINALDIRLGEVLLAKPLSPQQLATFRQELLALGFELLDNQQQQIIAKIKSIVIHHIHDLEDPQFVYTQILPQQLHREYSQLSKLFSETEGITIAQYVILQRVEKIKELLSYNELTLSEIAYRLGYSSVAYLSAQFKKTTGLTPSAFKNTRINLRKSLDQV